MSGERASEGGGPAAVRDPWRACGAPGTRAAPRGVVQLSRIGLSCLALAACASPEAEIEPEGTLGEAADLRSLRMDVDLGPCPRESPCGETFHLSADGWLQHGYRAQLFQGQLPAEDLAPLVRLASSATLIESVRKQPGCPGVIHRSEQLEIQILRGVFVGGETAGCSDGPLAALRYRLRAAARRLFPASGAEAVPAAPDPDVGRPFRLRGKLAFEALSLERVSSFCPPTRICGERLMVNRTAGLVEKLGGSLGGRFTGVTDFEPLSSVAERVDVLAELRRSLPCPGVDDASETIQVEFAGGMYMRALSTGCWQGPIADLRAAAEGLVARLAAEPAPDAGAADHPPDLRAAGP